MQDKITRNNIAKELSEEFGIPYVLAYKKIEKIISYMSSNLQNNLSISSLGSFSLKEKKSRMGRNPKSKEEFIISSRKVISFKKSKKLIL
jgi:integration host factor subunit alpha|tara:strand:- start:3275 stop:3544 length:270 start_codon:yes stop_codon:yes gene_type:complete